MLRSRGGANPAASSPAPGRPAGLWSPGAWDGAADLLLQRAALIARVQRNKAPDPLAGLKVDDEDLAGLLAELPGLERGDGPAARRIEEQLAGPLRAARGELARALCEDNELARLVRSAELSPAEAEILAVLVAVEADPRRQRLVGYLNDDVTQRHLTVWSLGQLFGRDEEVIKAVSPAGGLQRAGLLARAAEGTWSSAAIAVAPPVMWWLHGVRFVDPELPAGAELAHSPGSGTARRVVAAGPDRLRRIEAAAELLDAPAVLVSRLPTEALQWDALIRQATLAGAAVVLEVEEQFSRESRERVERAAHLAWAVTSPVDLPLASLFRQGWIEASVKPAAASEEEWAAAFPDHEEASARGSYRLTVDQLVEVAKAARATGGDLRTAVGRLAAGHIDATAIRIRPSRSWDDLILDDDRLAQVREIALRHRHRDTVYGEWGFSPQPSTGVVALFAGPSGTGKTLAAEIVAGDLGVDLYKVDLANLVSKYIGDTEKNLSRIFEAAEASRVVLFFDEADALLGKRSEVSDAHDRYANIEVAYLLQRLERYEGVAVLATNLANNLDPAFLRRLHIIVEFPMPQPAERLRIWRHNFPPGAPVDPSLDLTRLANRFEVTGGTIRNVVTRAAFLAAEAGCPITIDLLLVALRQEFEKLGRLVSSSDWEHVFSDNHDRAVPVRS